jgi:hypothetical protein
MKTTASLSDGSAARGPSTAVVAAGLVLAFGCVVMLLPEVWFITSSIVENRNLGIPLPNYISGPGVFLFVLPISFSLIGLVTAAGLMFLKEWARRSAIFLSTVPALSYALLVFLRPAALVSRPRPNQQLALMSIGSGLDFAVYVYFLVILVPFSVWWLILFTRPGVKVQFQCGKVMRT